MIRILRRWRRQLGYGALLLVALTACSAGEDAGTPAPQPPAYPTLATFVATVSPAAATTPIAFRWVPEPQAGQGTSAATFALVDLAEGFVSVTAEHCATYASDVMVFDPAGVVGTSSEPPLPYRPGSAAAAGGSLGEAGSGAPAVAGAPATEVTRNQFRIALGHTVEEWLYPAGDQDTFHFTGTAGQHVTIAMDRLSGDLDPYLELFGFFHSGQARVAFDNDGGAGTNALINAFQLPASASYAIVARGVRGTGKYRLRLSAVSTPLVPAPRIQRLSPGRVAATPFGSDFWVAIYGESFHPDAVVRWNGQLRPKFYSSSSLIYLRVRGADIGLVPLPPRLAFISVVNPGPGGGTSNTYPFSIEAPILGETELLAPAARSSATVGTAVAFSAAWTHPTDSWRVMRHMDLRLRDPEDRISAWVRVIEGEGASSRFELLDADGRAVASGLPGEERVLTSGPVTLDLAASEISGSGRTLTIGPVLVFAAGAEGTYAVEVLIEDKSGETQDIEVVGSFVITPEGCLTPIEGVTIALESTAP
jgi:hypothetical protein